MTKFHVAVIAVLFVAILPGAAAAEQNSKQAVAAKAAGQLGQEMRKKLTESMQLKGPAGAIDVCAKDAPAISARIERELGVTIKRTSLKFRNPKNAPDEAEKQLLGVLAAAQSSGEKLPQGVTTFPNDRNRFYKAITTEQACLKCHGNSSTLNEAVRKGLPAKQSVTKQ